MRAFGIRWGMWYEETSHRIHFPNDWIIHECPMKDAPPMSPADLAAALDNPYGTPDITELAKGKKTVGIVIDDLSRPTPTKDILGLIVERLVRAGVRVENITIFAGLGAHRPMLRQDFVKKVGQSLLSGVHVVNHNPFNHLAYLGTSALGSPISINQTYMEMDLKVAVGCILPHSLAGFSGGSKSIVPGIAGIDTLEANHSFACSKSGHTSSLGDPDNRIRLDMEDIAKKVGLEFIANVVLTSEMGIAGLFAGDPVAAHRIGSRFAEETYSTKVIPDADIVILNAFPKDTELIQIGNAFNVLALAPNPVHESGTIILTCAASEGAGVHYLFGPNMNLFSPWENKIPPRRFQNRRTLLYSPNVSRAEVKPFFEDRPIPVYSQWEQIILDLRAEYDRPTVAIYPEASIQLGNR